MSIVNNGAEALRLQIAALLQKRLACYEQSGSLGVVAVERRIPIVNGRDKLGREYLRAFFLYFLQSFLLLEERLRKRPIHLPIARFICVIE